MTETITRAKEENGKIRITAVSDTGATFILTLEDNADLEKNLQRKLAETKKIGVPGEPYTEEEDYPDSEKYAYLIDMEFNKTAAAVEE